MTRPLELKIQGDSKSAAAALEAAAREMGRTAREADKMGRAFDAAKRDAEQLDRELAKNAATVALLAREYSKADANIREGITQRLDVERNAGNELRRIRKEIIGDTEKDAKAATKAAESAARDFEKLAKVGLKDAVTAGGQEAANTFSQLFEGGIIKSLENPAVLAAVGVLAAAFGPMLASALGGAILAAGAGGAIAAGIAGAAQVDPKRVGDAWSAEIGRIKGQWLDASTAFVGPTVQAIHTIGTEISKAPIDQMFAKAAEYVVPLSKGVAGFSAGIIRGVDALVEKAGPVIQVLEQELPQVGQAIEVALSEIAGGNRGAADGLRDLLHVLEAAIVGTGKLIGSAEDIYHAFKQVGEAVRGVTDELVIAKSLTDFFAPKDVHAYAVSLDGAAHGLDKYATEADKAKAATDELNNKIKEIGDAFSQMGKSVEGELTNKLLDRMLSLDDATLSWEESLAKLDDTAKKNGTSLDVLNEKTGKYNDKALANEKQLLAAVKANGELYQQNLLSGMSADQAAAAYEHNSQVLRQQAIDAGYNAKAVDNLIGKYGAVPTEVKTILATEGLTSALNHLGQILVDLNSLDKKTFTTKYYVDTYFNNYGGSYGGGEAAKHQLPPGHRASGGPVIKGMPYIVGEKQPELFVPSVSGMIVPHVPQTSIASKWGGTGSGAQAITVTLDFAGNTNSAFATAFMRLVRNGDIQIN